MTLLAALNRLHTLFEGDTNTPLTGDDYDVRVALINDAQEEWASQADVKWQELYTVDTSNEGDGTTRAFDLPADFGHLSGPIALYDTVHDAFTPIASVPIGQASGYASHSDLACWVADGQLVFNVAPEDGATVYIYYYKTPTALTTNADVLPMSQPRYAIYYALARLTEQSGDFTRYNTNMQKAEDLLASMKIDNESLGEGVPNTIKTTTAGFGV